MENSNSGFNTKCCICGTIRNCGKFLDNVLNNIQQIGDLFSEYKIIIAYDDSDDNSLQILRDFEKLHPDKIIISIGSEPLHKYRVYNIARARNKCLEIMKMNYSNYEYFIMMDCDDVCSIQVKLDPLIYYLNNNEKWDALSFNKDPYYDFWALSIYPYVFSCFHFKDWEAWGRYIKEIIKKTPPKTLIPCLSAFNGFSIYKTNKFLNCFYDHRPRIDLFPVNLIQDNINVAGPMLFKGKAREVDCEHRSFHMMAINMNNAKIRIAPEVIF
uniref:Glycosyltransferase 2-like domain-containing protein n=1 Tax=viral metagenome TaxID=1070528 RepID=A0A6C0KR50_9ZZZZ